ncbi:MAG: hypothetical protein WCL32_07900 [Planctomycetota bacterium]
MLNKSIDIIPGTIRFILENPPNIVELAFLEKPGQSRGRLSIPIDAEPGADGVDAVAKREGFIERRSSRIFSRRYDERRRDN